MRTTKFTENGNVLIIERSFDAPVELVWRAWTEAELLDQWWAPKPWKSVTKSMNFKENGERLYAMVGPANEEHWCITTYRTISLHDHFTGEDAFSDKEGNINDQFPVAAFKNQFENISGKTSVSIHTKYASEEHLKQVIEMGMKEGLSMAFENLDTVLQENQ